jgi:hypothetical protein
MRWRGLAAVRTELLLGTGDGPFAIDTAAVVVHPHAAHPYGKAAF